MNKLILVSVLVFSTLVFLAKNGFSQDEQVKFVLVDSPAAFTGGDQARINFFKENIKYPDSALIHHIEGVVYVSFVVEKDGSISNVKVLRGIGGGCDEEAVRVVLSMPKWIPAKVKEEYVRCQFNLPVKFSLN
jgi:protein TonB